MGKGENGKWEKGKIKERKGMKIEYKKGNSERATEYERN